MNKSRILLILALVLVFSNLFATSVFADSQPSIGIELDKTEAQVGDTIKATVKVNEIKNLSGFQLNIRYNQEVLKVVSEDGSDSFGDTTCPQNGELVMNKSYSLFPAAANIISAGVLNFGRSYIDMESYRKSNKPESTGSLAVLYFKVIKDAATEIIFEELGTMPGSNKGTMLFDWDGNLIDEYAVNDSPKINPNSSPAPMPSYTVKPIARPTEQQTAEKNNTIYIIILIAVVLIVVALLFVFIFIGKNKDSEDIDDEQEDYDEDSEGQDGNGSEDIKNQDSKDSDDESDDYDET